ncbi:MAG TPA: SUF system Fe-S cluster assembly regulator [Planctomycetota bacterium]|nr:SUF system Fe-S cluster assembly regulator [Planctomycetota bacterium]
MIRMTRLTDYGIMLLTLFARDEKSPMRSARDLSAEARLPLPTVSKLLKVLARHHLLEAHRGVKGGFRLSRPADRITVAEIIHALEGPIGVTECSSHDGACDIERSCIVRNNWRKINVVVLEALGKITLAEMTQPLPSLETPVHPRGDLARAVATHKR